LKSSVIGSKVISTLADAAAQRSSLLTFAFPAVYILNLFPQFGCYKIHSQGGSMDEDQRQWLNQFWRNIGITEYLRMAVAISVWFAIGVGLAVWAGSTFLSFTIFLLFCFTLFGFASLSLRWKPAYQLSRAIIGNKNLPTEAFPHKSKIAAPRR
jgi:hypothetical protein